MKFTLIILTVLAPFFAHAGGGGGLRPGMQTMMARNPEIVFSLGSKDGVDYFAHGHLDNNNWKVQKLALPAEVLKNNDALYTAIKKSQINNIWIQIQE